MPARRNPAAYYCNGADPHTGYTSVRNPFSKDVEYAKAKDGEKHEQHEARNIITRKDLQSTGSGGCTGFGRLLDLHFYTYIFTGNR
jgi:hypothetical protein